MANSNNLPFPWLRKYGNAHDYRWRRENNTYIRPLGLTEAGFDGDGRYWEGRADMNVLLEVEIKTSLTGNAFRERILIAWTLLRCQHLLLRARTLQDEANDFAIRGLHFAVDVYQNVGKAIEDAGWHLCFLEDYYGSINERDFYLHCTNVRRIVDPDVALTKLFVLPIKERDGKKFLNFQFIIAHETCDGRTSYPWMRDLIQALNESEDVLRRRIAHAIRPETMEKHLPPPQEALYPPAFPGSSLARQRWFWTIARILRHVRKQLPVGFDNPLKRSQSRSEAVPLSPVYGRVLDYSKPPVLNSYSTWLDVSKSHMDRLYRLCKEVNASLGAGIYALAGLIQMEFHEEQRPNESTRKYFITGFPLDPRAFFGFSTDPDSMMLAFSDGIALPFLSSDLDLAGRLRLLVRQAQSQLASYQKRARPTGEAAKMQYLNSRGAGLVLANQYLFSLERSAHACPDAHTQAGSVQGEYLPRMNPTVQTCGTSSVGNRDALLRGGIHSLEDEEKDFAADFRDLTHSVRPREGEFLVGIGGSSQGLYCCPSVDANNIDPVMVERWRDRFETILEEIDDDRRARL